MKHFNTNCVKDNVKILVKQITNNELVETTSKTIQYNTIQINKTYFVFYGI